MHLPLLSSLVALLAFLLLAPASANAIVGHGPQIGGPGARSPRVASPAIQHRLSQGTAWQDFLQRRGGEWYVRWDETTGLPIRFYGSGVAIHPSQLEDDARAWDLGWSILQEEQALLGGRALSLSDLQPWTLDRRDGILTLSFQQSHAGHPVEGSRVSLRFKAGRWVMAQFEAFPGIDAQKEPSISSTQAASFARASLGWTMAQSEEWAAAKLIVLPIFNGKRITYRLAWRVQLRSKEQPSARWIDVDAENGAILRWEERIRFAQVNVKATHDDRYPLADLTTSVMPYAQLNGGPSSVDDAEEDEDDSPASYQADGAGAFTYNEEFPASFNWTVGSHLFDISSLDSQGLQEQESEVLADGEALLATSDPEAGNSRTRRQLAQLNAHIAAHVVRERALAIDPDFDWADDQVTIRVNDDSMPCNAWFDETASLNFVRRSSGCSNTGRLHDVIYHEYGHGFHWFSIIPGAGGFGDGALAEGFSDYLSSTITDDANLSPNFFVGDTQPLRQLEPNQSWPEDIDEDPHITGLIAGGALWDLRGLLVAEYGKERGVADADNLFWHAAARSVETPDVYDEVLLADDDDGNLANGTPNSCLINEAFLPHGMGDESLNGTSFGLSHASSANYEVQTEIQLAVEAQLANPECSEGRLGQLRLHWTNDENAEASDFTVLEQDLSGLEDANVTFTIPAQPEGIYLRYRIELLDLAGTTVRSLPSPEITDPWFGAWVGGGELLYSDDFESGDGGLLHELLSGQPNEGADDWQWGSPGGRSGDPTVAASGSKVWGNDLSPEDQWNGAYQPNIHNVLTLDAIEVGELGDSRLYLQFERWLGVEDGHWDSAEVRANDQVVWTQFASSDPDNSSSHHVDDQWLFRSYDITDHIEDGEVEISFHLVSDEGLEFGGWNIDDLALRLAVPGSASGDDDNNGAIEDGISQGGFRGAGAGCDCAAQGTIAKLSESPQLYGLLVLGGSLGLRRRRSPRL